MGETKHTQSQAKRDLDEKLRLSTPSRQVLEELAVACAKNPSPDNTFQYAFALSKSNEKSELRYAITILDGLVSEGYSHQVDCLYAAATALYLLGDYEEARTRCENILRSKPGSRIASELHLASIESQEQKESQQLKQAAVGGTVAVAALGVIAGVASVMLAKKN
ncbi:expressed unknown protein [Seminavis robusta]|uniref:Mitochondrial fission 1 protein n=1 Tax=Seminavis robusta TaxID=568900 RepID=A0A9N8DE43_9STRA|nr:expressed unknown protein [Seminavis robusta]|eukprot:Sro97_g050030.1 n/a (165) ;mRNA; f:69245-69739